MLSRRVLAQQETHMGPNEMVYIVDDDSRVGKALSTILLAGQELQT
jgi:FixJ family two-component response regulator